MKSYDPIKSHGSITKTHDPIIKSYDPIIKTMTPLKDMALSPKAITSKFHTTMNSEIGGHTHQQMTHTYNVI